MVGLSKLNNTSAQLGLAAGWAWQQQEEKKGEKENEPERKRTLSLPKRNYSKEVKERTQHAYNFLETEVRNG